MMLDILTKPSFNRYSFDKRFMQDTLDLLCGNKTGHMNTYAFNEPDPAISNDPVRGGEYWTRMVETFPGYYLIEKESEVLKAYASTIGRYLPAGMTSVDLGPGEAEAVIRKTIPFNQSLRNISNFISVDINSHFSRQACQIVKDALSVPSTSITGNFFVEQLDLPVENRTVATLFGGLLCNAPHSDLVPGYKHLQETFVSLSHNFKNGDYLVVTQDTNQNDKILLEAYSHPLMGRYILSVLHKIKRDLPTENFNPFSYEFFAHWNKEENLLSLNARLSKESSPQSFKIGDVPFTIGNERILPLVNSYKFSVEKFIKAAEGAGFRSRRKYQMPGNPIVVHVLEYQSTSYMQEGMQKGI